MEKIYIITLGTMNVEVKGKNEQDAARVLFNLFKHYPETFMQALTVREAKGTVSPYTA